jgi:hypothetical protein
MLHKSLVEATRTVLQALFSAAEVYYPGDKWLRAAIVQFGLDPRVLMAFDRVWERGMEPTDQIEALSQLHSLLNEGG